MEFPSETSVLTLAVEAAVVEPMATSRGKRAEADERLDRAEFRIEVEPDEVTGVSVGVSQAPFIKRACGELAEAAVGVDPFDDFGFVEMPAEDEIGVSGEEAFG
jgi:hypothetical protein